MVTKQQLIEAAKAKGAEVTIHKDEYTSKECIGIRLKSKHVFYWFDAQPWDEHVFFTHTYSQNTGRTSKSYRAGWIVLRSLALMD
jgi:hypothetical protein